MAVVWEVVAARRVADGGGVASLSGVDSGKSCALVETFPLVRRSLS